MPELSCRECGTSFEPAQPNALFCKAACRHTFNNRRAVRGALLYDLWMSHRYDRGVAKALNFFALMCAVGQKYRQEDRERRQGATSWLKAGEVLATKPWLRDLIPGKDTVPRA